MESQLTHWMCFARACSKLDVERFRPTLGHNGPWMHVLATPTTKCHVPITVFVLTSMLRKFY